MARFYLVENEAANPMAGHYARQVRQPAGYFDVEYYTVPAEMEEAHCPHGPHPSRQSANACLTERKAADTDNTQAWRVYACDDSADLSRDMRDQLDWANGMDVAP